MKWALLDSLLMGDEFSNDHFSKQSKVYKKFRPTYPPELFKYLESLCKQKELAWDCATGSGQAAVDLAKYFKKVIATDISENQLQLAPKLENITYFISPAESCPSIKAESCDLLVVAQAYHWLNEEKFLAEARRVLKADGILAIWNYDWATIDPNIDLILNKFGKELLAKYWPSEVQKRANPGRILPKGFDIIKPKLFNLEVDWNLDQMRGYLDSWSATQIYKDEHRRDPYLDIDSTLRGAWGSSDQIRKVAWPLHFLVARKK